MVKLSCRGFSLRIIFPSSNYVAFGCPGCVKLGTGTDLSGFDTFYSYLTSYKRFFLFLGRAGTKCIDILPIPLLSLASVNGRCHGVSGGGIGCCYKLSPFTSRIRIEE